MHKLGLRFVLSGTLGMIAGSCNDGSGWGSETDGDDGGTDSCPVGTLQCPCTGGGACDPGLACRSNICVNASGDDGGSGNTSGGTGDGSSDGTGGGTGGTGDTSGATGTGGTGDTSTGPFCGDDIQNDGEECDGSDLAEQDCTDHEFVGGVLTCDGSCEYDTSDCNDCSDGIVDPDEACDCGGAGSPCTTAELDNKSCADFPPFTNGTLGCQSPDNCTFDTSDCYYCGDGNADPIEACDGADMGGNTCQTEGFTGGDLACYESCVLDTRGCTGPTEITECSTPNATIPDLGNVVDTITVTQSGLVTDVNVLVQVSHIWLADLDIRVRHLGTNRWLVRDECSADDDINATFNDEGSTLVCDVSSPAISGHVIPEESLATYDGMQAQGDWDLQVFDDAILLDGTLDHWCVTISF